MIVSADLFALGDVSLYCECVVWQWDTGLDKAGVKIWHVRIVQRHQRLTERKVNNAVYSTIFM